MSDRLERAVLLLVKEMQAANKNFEKLIQSVDALTATTREGYEGPIRMLTEMEEGMQSDAPASSRDEDDVDELDEDELWRLG